MLENTIFVPRLIATAIPMFTIKMTGSNQELHMISRSAVTSATAMTIIYSGSSVAGIIFELISDEAKKAISAADVILAKGQGNYESISGQGRHIFYEFLCKCDLFVSRFNVPKLTGMFVEEKN